ncbi:MAG: YkgJ family cysteine cluster protein [Candidatus Sericytochromatia bacterium]|nr:YkgJ family cysteine cluster protein [Candidatus Sericytochromatia bacterium]
MRYLFRRQAVPSTAPEGGFDQALADEQAVDPAPLAEAMQVVSERLPAADHFAGSEDPRDLYHLLDVLADGVKASFPQSLCRAGCGSCCYYPVALFTITHTEWQVIARHLENHWDEAQREALVQRYRSRFTGLWRWVFGWAQRSFTALLLSAPLIERARIACPFLVEERCSIYPVRPYPCRTFGHFAVRTWLTAPRIYACDVQGQRLAQGLFGEGPRLQLPVLNPISRRIRLLCQGPKLSLPVWLGIWIWRQERRKRSGGSIAAQEPAETQARKASP